MSEGSEIPKGARIRALLIVVLGLAAGYFGVVQPLQEAQEHAQEITTGFKISFMALPLIILGVLAFIFPHLMSDQSFLLKSKGKLSVTGWFIVALLAVLGGGTYFFVQHQLAALGYVDK